jgi:hypothetical protein
MDRLLCKIFGHHYKIVKSIRHIKEYDCVHCGKQVTSTDGRKVYPLTSEMRKINNAVEAFYRNAANQTSSSRKSVA